MRERERERERESEKEREQGIGGVGARKRGSEGARARKRKTGREVWFTQTVHLTLPLTFAGLGERALNLGYSLPFLRSSAHFLRSGDKTPCRMTGWIHTRAG